MSTSPNPRVLLIDAGSSRLKWAWWRERRIEDTGAIPHRGDIDGAVTGIPPGRQIERVLVVSVLDDTDTARLLSLLSQKTGVVPELADVATDCVGLTNGYENPRQLGLDRWLAMLGAFGRHPEALVVVDCGTAVTLDVVDADGLHLGGQIIPGLSAMRRGLAAATRLIINPAGALIDGNLLGRSTERCIDAGTHHAVAALVDRVVNRYGQSAGMPRVIMTGGDAEKIAHLIEASVEIHPHLVLEGLAVWGGLGIIE